MFVILKNFLTSIIFILLHYVWRQWASKFDHLLYFVMSDEIPWEMYDWGRLHQLSIPIAIDHEQFFSDEGGFSYPPQLTTQDLWVSTYPRLQTIKATDRGGAGIVDIKHNVVMHHRHACFYFSSMEYTPLNKCGRRAWNPGDLRIFSPSERTTYYLSLLLSYST